MTSFRDMISGDEPVVAPLALSPLAAKLAEAAGFRALYVGGGALGYLKCVTEANLTEPEFVQIAIDIRTVCALPLILDAAGGWGDPMHLHRTIGMAEAAGFSAIEIEDQLLPKRAHHHAGREHVIPMEAMVDKVKEAAAARSDPDFVIIGRTNAARSVSREDSLRRLEAYKAAGADMLLSFMRDAEEVRYLGERLPAPLMLMLGPGRTLKSLDMTLDDVAGLGYRLVVDSMTPLAVVHEALKSCYANIAKGEPDPHLLPDPPQAVPRLNETIGLEKLLDIERRTTERDA